MALWCGVNKQPMQCFVELFEIVEEGQGDGIVAKIVADNVNSNSLKILLTL